MVMFLYPSLEHNCSVMRKHELLAQHYNKHSEMSCTAVSSRISISGWDFNSRHESMHQWTHARNTAVTNLLQCLSSVNQFSSMKLDNKLIFNKLISMCLFSAPRVLLKPFQMQHPFCLFFGENKLLANKMLL